MKKVLFIMMLGLMFGQTNATSKIIEYERDINTSLNSTQENNIFREHLILQENSYRDEDELLEFIESILETHLVPGLSISVVKDDAIVWEKQLGYANIADNVFSIISNNFGKTYSITHSTGNNPEMGVVIIIIGICFNQV